MLASTPGVTVESIETDRVYYTARGFEITNFQYDGVGIPFVFGNVTGNFDTALYDQVDIVRGANGLLSSTGNPSATVNFTRKRPGTKLAAAVNSTFAEWTHRFGNGWTGKATATYNLAPTDSKLFFVSGIQDRATGLGLTSYPSLYRSKFKQKLADASVTGKFGLGGRSHDLSFGASWAESQVDQFSAYGQGIGTDLPGNVAVDGSYPEPAFDASIANSGFTDKRKNAFVAVRWNLADDWKLLTGANHAKVDTRGNSYGVDSYRSAGKTSPYAGLVVDIDRNVSAYASYTAIFNPQSELDARRQPLAPVEGKTVELGVKSDWLGGRLNLSGAVFKTEQDNAAQLLGYLNGVDAYYEGIGAKSKGVELEASGQITRNWNANIGFAQLSMEGDAGEDVKTYIPRRTLRAATTYRFPALPALKVGASVNWQSRIYLDDVAAVIRQGSYATVGLMAQYDITPHVKLSANVYNLADKRHLTSLYWNQSYYAAPRNASVSLNWSY
jgi:outer-membrane receptor for ferric coprogen and ferric-rhodotorulic acid